MTVEMVESSSVTWCQRVPSWRGLLWLRSMGGQYCGEFHCQFVQNSKRRRTLDVSVH